MTMTSIDPGRYAPWNTAQIFMLESARRRAARLLHRAGAFPRASCRCLEVGYGRQGWLPVLLSWGVQETNLHGIEVDPERARVARSLLPAADLRVGDATALPWPSSGFGLVVASTVFTSILDVAVRHRLAREIVRVLAPGGALLWYDFAVNNPRNANVRGIGNREVRELFPELDGALHRSTLAPPLARFIAPRSWPFAAVLESVPLLRTHRIGVMVKSV